MISSGLILIFMWSMNRAARRKQQREQMELESLMRNREMETLRRMQAQAKMAGAIDGGQPQLNYRMPGENSSDTYRRMNYQDRRTNRHDPYQTHMPVYEGQYYPS